MALSLVGLRATKEDPRRALLARLAGAAPAEALLELAAFHLGRPREAVRFRDVLIAVGPRVFPHPLDVPPLTLHLLLAADPIVAACRSAGDDLLAAASLMAGVLAIRPFADANARVALDVAQLALMARWGTPPLALPLQAHRKIGTALGDVFGPIVTTPAAFAALRDGLIQTFRDHDLERARAIPALVAAAGWLGAHATRSPTCPT